ncbi:MAG: 23S rRNA (pseudouridine(1915)-N(3))-methyltransferase RlmH [Parachlamydiaceae bacterium]|nr:23S rRNA (pseudouridine(1915)-N(3))-methyltransferase RlmH [Parachlamydiaceae bacterium]
MIKIKIISVGKNKEEWLETALNEYVKRLTPIATLSFQWAKDDQHLLDIALKEPLLICLDPQGSSLSSEEFSSFLHQKLQLGGSRLTFIIGGADGLPTTLKSSPLLSLSKMTFTHQITRLILVEQIYRAFEIARGSQYHK